MGKTLDFDYQLFEKVIVYNFITDVNYFEIVYEHIKPSYFSNENHKKVVKILCEYYKNHLKVPNTTELKLNFTNTEDRKALKEVLTSFSDIDKKYDREILLKNSEKFFKEKAVQHTVLNTYVDIQSGEINSSEILKAFENACYISLHDNKGFDYLESIDEHCVELQKVFTYIPSGWKWLDERIGGGFLSTGRAVYVFYGVTNVGKSIFLGNIATNILSQDKTVVLISMEMSEQVYAKRISAQLTKIPMDNLVSEIGLLKTKINSYKLKNKNAKLIIKEYPPKTVTTLHIKSYIEKLISSGIKPDVIVLDYINLIAPLDKGESSYAAIKEITESIRSLSYLFECPIITATQANRSAYNEANPGLETTSESMGLSHTVDAQFSIWTEKEEMDLNLIHLGITKNRFGPRDCQTVLEIDYPTLSLKDPESDTIPMMISDKKQINKSNSVNDTVALLESLGDDIDN